MVYIDIICGFLGSGKTTLIKRLLETDYLNQRIAIIENEYGKIGFDALELVSEEIAIKELSSGCVCCTLRGALRSGLRELISATNPDRIIIEPSGVADISDLMNACKNLADTEVCRVITVVNAKKVSRLLRACGELFKNQIKSSCCVYLNFAEEMSPQEIGVVHTQLLNLKQDLLIVDSPLEDLNCNTFPAMITPEKEIHSILRKHFLKKNYEGEEAAFSCYCFRFSTLFTFDQTQTLFASFFSADIGEIYRAKGLLELNDGKVVKCDYIFGDSFYQIIDRKYPDTNLLTVIGRNLDQKALFEHLNGLVGGVTLL